MKMDWYKLSAAAVVQQLGSDPGPGLLSAEARQRLVQYGSNELVEKAGRSRAAIIRDRLSGVLTIPLSRASADIALVHFSGSHASPNEKPYYQEVVQSLDENIRHLHGRALQQILVAEFLCNELF